MSRLRVPCQACGPVVVPAEAVLIRHARGGDRIEWSCPLCHTDATWRPHPSYRGYLDGARIHVREVWEVPKEVADPIRRIASTTRTEERITLLVEAYRVRLARRNDLAEVAREQQAALDEIRRRNKEEGK